MSVVIEVVVNSVPVPVLLDDAAVDAIAAAIPTPTTPTEPSPFMTVVEAAAYLRCSRQRIDDLLSQKRLTRVKEGARTLVRRDEINTYLERSH